MAKDLDPKSLAELRRTLEALREEAKDYRDIMEDNETFLAMMLDKRLEKYKEESRAHKRKIAQQIENIKTLEGEEKEKAKADLERMKDALDNSEKQVKAQEQQTRAIKKTTAEMMGMSEVYGRHEVVTIDLVARMTKLGLSLTNVGSSFAILAGAVGGVFNTIINLAIETDKTSKSLARQTGINIELADSMIMAQRETAHLGVELEDQANAFKALFSTYTDFSLQSKTVQAEITQTTAVLEKLGIANEDVAKGVQNSTKFFGQTGEAAAATARDLASFAGIIGVTPKQIASDFAGVGESIAKLGSDGPRAFKDLAIAAKITGIEIGKLMQITDKFDTFEGAAEQAGKLNAALGGNFVNAMDLMMVTDPVERFEMIRDSILDTGLTFDDMSYYQRKFFTEAAGLDNVGDLAKMMSGNFDDLAGSVNMSSKEYADLEERAKELQNFQEELLPVVKPIIDEFRNLAKTISEDEELLDTLRTSFEYIGEAALLLVENLGLIAKAIGVAFGVGAINTVLSLATGVNFLEKGIGAAQGKIRGLASNIPGLGKVFGSTESRAEGVAGSFTSMSSAASGLAEHGEDAAGAIEAMGESSEAASDSLKSMTVPILAIGAAVAIAAFGVSFLIKAFTGLSGGQATAAVVAIGALGAALYFLMTAATAAAAPTTIAAGAILAIGAAVAIAAIGMSVLVESFKGLETSLGSFVGFAIVLAVFTKGAIALGAAGAAASGGILVLAGALGILAYSFGNLGDEMQPFNTFVTGLSSLVDNVADLTKVKAEIVGISDAMAKVPAFAGASVQTVAAMATGFNAAPTSVMFKPEQTFVLEIDGEQFRTKIKNVQGEEVLKRLQQE